MASAKVATRSLRVRLRSAAAALVPWAGPVAIAAAPNGRQPIESRPAILANVTWQWIAVGVIEVLAVGYLVYRFVGPRRRPTSLQKPDVKVSSLVRKRKPDER
jgi:hypothetical protein